MKLFYLNARVAQEAGGSLTSCEARRARGVVARGAVVVAAVVVGRCARVAVIYRA